MRAKWRRGTPEVGLGTAAIQGLVRAALPAARVTGHHRTLGGKSNTNIAVKLAEAPFRLLLRLYQRDPRQARKEAALSRLAAERGVPTARFIYFAETNPVTGEPYALLEWIDGHRLESVTHELGRHGLAALARPIGQVMAAIHAVYFPKTGFFGDEARVATAVDLGRDGLLAYLRRCLVDGLGGKRLGEKQTEALIAFVEREGHRLDAWLQSPCLAHSDFNGSNILVRRDSKGAWTVAAVLDWEFAFAGSPAFDFGNLLRPPLGESSAFVAGLVDAYGQAGGALPADWRRLARIADLYSWADFLARPDPGHALIADARRMIEATIAAK